MDLVVKQLENSFVESQQNDRRLMSKLQMDNVKTKGLHFQLQEVQKENKQLINILQQKFSEHPPSRTTRSETDFTSHSTVSMVHLQYMYDEVLANYEGLLRVLESRSKELKSCYDENDNLKNKINNVCLQLSEYESVMKKISDKYVALRQRKDAKITRIRNDRNTLRMAHEQLVNVWHKENAEKFDAFTQILQKTSNPKRALLVQEVRRTNKLEYENELLKQEILYLKSKINNNG